MYQKGEKHLISPTTWGWLTWVVRFLCPAWVGRGVATWVLSVLLFLTLPVAATEQAQPIIVALSVNQVEKDTIDALQRGDNYFIPLSAFHQSLNLTPTLVDDTRRYDTPIGGLNLPNSAVIRHNHQDFADIAAIKQMGIPIVFNQSAYAIEIYPPWEGKTQAKTSEKSDTTAAKKPTVSIDYYPEKAAINQIDINGQWYQTHSDGGDKTWQFATQVGLSGHALGGFFGANFTYRRDSQSTRFSGERAVSVDNLYWADYGEQFAFRLGVNQPGYGIDGTEFSGINVAYSNRGIAPHITHFGRHTRTLLQNNYSDFRTIIGQGPVGGIAELRINHRPIARVRIGLDKRYEFRNLDVSRLYDNQYNVEIALFEHNFSNQPLKVIPYNLSKRQSNVGTGELLIESGVGKTGNVFNRDTFNDRENYFFAYGEYGLHNNFALRAGFSKGSEQSAMAGINVGLSPRTNWDISYHHTRNNQQLQSLLSYQANQLSANYQFNYQKNNPNNREEHEQRHTLYLYYRPNDKINLSSNIYHNEYSDKPREDYFNATLNIRPHKRLYATLTRNQNNDYSYRVDWQVPDEKTRIGFDGDKDKNGLYIDHSLFSHTGIGATWVHYRHQHTDIDNNEDFYRAYINHQINEKNKVFANANKRGENIGYEIGWQATVNRGLNFALGYQHNRHVQTDNSNSTNTVTTLTTGDTHYAYLQFTISLAKTPGYGYRFDKRGYSNNGTIIADIKYDKDLAIDNDKMQLQLNGQTVRSEKIDEGRYVVSDVKPGIYELGLDNKDLPIEYSAGDLAKPTIQVAHAATTVVPYHLEKRLGFSGQLSDEIETTITVLQNGKTVTTTQSNAFGCYQVLGLKPGTYQLSANGYQNTGVTLDNTFLFEVNLSK